MPFPPVSPLNLCDDSFPPLDEQVTAIAKDSSGNVYVTGQFLTIPTELTGAIALVDSTLGNSIAGVFPRVRPAGALYGDLPNTNRTTAVESVISDGNGGYYIGGAFRSLVGMPSHWDNMAKLAVHILSNGQVDPDFFVQIQVADTSFLGGGVHALYLDSINNVLYLGGDFPMGPLVTATTAEYNGLVAVNATTGDLLTAWKPAGAFVTSFHYDGSYLYAGGSFSSIEGQSCNNLVRFDITSFPPTISNINGMGANSTIYSITSGGGYLYIGGVFTGAFSAGGSQETRNRIARFSGTILDSWNPNANSQVSAIQISGGFAYAGGAFSNIGGQARKGIAKLDLTSGLADSWIASPSLTILVVYSMLVDGPDIYLGGTIEEPTLTLPWNLVKLSVADGTLNTSWNPAPTYYAGVYGLLKRGSDIICWGNFHGINCLVRTGGAKFNSDGEFVPEFNPNTTVAFAEESNTQGSAVIDIAAGTFLAVCRGQSLQLFDLVTGQLSSNTVTVVGNGINCIIQKPNTTNFYIGGNFTSVSPSLTTRNKIAEINGTTLQAEEWPLLGAAGGVTSFGQVNTLYVGSNGDVYVGGTFTSLNSQSRFAIGSIDATGALTSFNPSVSVSDYVNSITEWAGGVLIGEDNLILVDYSGNLLADFNIPSQGDGARFIVAENGRLYVMNTQLFNTNVGSGYSRPFLIEYTASGGIIPTGWNGNPFLEIAPGYGWFADNSVADGCFCSTDKYLYVGCFGVYGFGGGAGVHGLRLKFPERVNLVGPDLINGQSKAIESTDLGVTISGSPLFGITGSQGVTGAQGITGIAFVGPRGVAPRGDTGVLGLTGLQGIRGQTGASASALARRGPTGLSPTGLSPIGATGLIGETGIGMAETTNSIVTTSPFTVTESHQVLLVDTDTLAITVNLPTPSLFLRGKQYSIYDSTGNASNNPITIVPTDNSINGQASFVININYGSVDIYTSGIEYYGRTFDFGDDGVVGIMGPTGMAGV